MRKLGVIDLPTMQRYMNLWYSLSLDLFGGEVSSNAASFFATGVKGRAKEDEYEEHRALDGSYAMDMVKDGKVVREDVPLRNAMNEVLRDAYVVDCQRGVDRWNRAIEGKGIPFKLTACRAGAFTVTSRHLRGMFATPEGELLTKEEFNRRRDEWLPSDGDKAFVKSLMEKPIWDPGSRWPTGSLRRSRVASRAALLTSST